LKESCLLRCPTCLSGMLVDSGPVGQVSHTCLPAQLAALLPDSNGHRLPCLMICLHDCTQACITKVICSQTNLVWGMHDCRALIQCLRRMGPAHCYATSMSPPALEQTIAAMHVLRGRDGSDRGVKKIQQLHDNANYFRHKLAAMGCSVLGDNDSPVMVSVMYLSLHAAKCCFVPCSIALTSLSSTSLCSCSVR